MKNNLEETAVIVWFWAFAAFAFALIAVLVAGGCR